MSCLDDFYEEGLNEAYNKLLRGICAASTVDDEKYKKEILKHSLEIFTDEFKAMCGIETKVKCKNKGIWLNASQYLDYMINNELDKIKNNKLDGVVLSQPIYGLFTMNDLIDNDILFYITDDFDTTEYYNLEKTIKNHEVDLERRVK